MLEGICPIPQLFVVALLCFAALVKGISEIIMTLPLQAGIGREQSLAKGFQRFSVFFRLVSGRAGIEMQLILRLRLRMRF